MRNERISVLNEIERGHARDIADVDAMLERGLISSSLTLELFARIRPDLIRYPAIDIPSFERSVNEFFQFK